jgi:hypothetical protein
VAISTGLPLSGIPVILVANLHLYNSLIVCTLVYRHLLTELGSRPKRVVLGDVQMLASPVAPDIKAWMEIQMIGPHLREAKHHTQRM